MARNFTVKAIIEAVDKITAPVKQIQKTMKTFTLSIEKGAKAASRVTDRLSKSLIKVGKRLFRFGAIAATAAIAATTVAITKIANAADELAKRADRLSFPIEELQQWQFVAQQSGLSTEKFDKGLENFTRVLGDAKLGGGALVTTLGKFNTPLLKQLTNTNDASKAFKLLIDAMRKTEDQNVKLALSAAAFGRTGGTQFINIINQTEEAITKLIDEQIENGIITKENAKNAEIYNDALNSLRRSFKGILDSAILPLLPQLSRLLIMFRELVISNKQLIILQINEFINEIKVSINNVIEAFKRLQEQEDIMIRLAKLTDILSKSFIFLVDNGKSIAIIIAAFLALNVALKATVVVMGLVNIAMNANKVGVLITVLIAATAAIIGFIAGSGKLLKVIAFISKSLVILSIELVKLSNIFTSIPNQITEAWGILGAFFDDLLTGISHKFLSFLDKVTEVINKVIAFISKVLVILSIELVKLSNIFTSIPNQITEAWGILGAFFDDLLTGISDKFLSFLDKVTEVINKVKSLSRFIPFVGSNDAPIGRPINDRIFDNAKQNIFDFNNFPGMNRQSSDIGPSIVSPQERVARIIEESRTSTMSELTIKDGTGRAEVTSGPLPSGIKILNSGSF